MGSIYHFEHPLTQQYIEEYASQEQLMHRYTGYIPKANKLYFSPFRQEAKPSCSFYTGKRGDLLLRDFGEGSSYTWMNIIMRKYNCSFGKALRIAAEDLGLVQSTVSRDVIKLIEIPKIESTVTNIQVEVKEYSQKELDWWNKFGISRLTLKKYNVFSIKTVFLNGKILTFSSEDNPIYGYYLGSKDDFELWKIYIPKSKNKGYRFLTNAKESIIQGWKQLPKSGNVVVITKSQKDVMLCYELGISAIAPNSETVFISDNRLQQLKERFKYIIVLFDNDYAGISSMKKLKKQYPELYYTFIPRKYSKDLSDFHKKYGIDKTIKMIKQYKEWLNGQLNISLNKEN